MARLTSYASATAALAAAAALACADPSSPTHESAPSLESASAAGRAPTLEPQHSGTTNRLQAISPVNENVVWASGVGGTYALTTNGGGRWRGSCRARSCSSSATCTA